MPPVSIRPVRPTDIAAITRIYAHAVRHGTASFELDPPDTNEMTRRLEALSAGGFPCLVAEAKDEILGYAYAGPYRARPAYRFTVEDSVYIAPDAQRQGLGRLLLDRLIVESEARGYRQMIAVIGDSAEIRPLARQFADAAAARSGRGQPAALRSEHDPAKACPGLRPGGNRFSEKIMFKQKSWTLIRLD